MDPGRARIRDAVTSVRRDGRWQPARPPGSIERCSPLLERYFGALSGLGPTSARGPRSSVPGVFGPVEPETPRTQSRFRPPELSHDRSVSANRWGVLLAPKRWSVEGADHEVPWAYFPPRRVLYVYLLEIHQSGTEQCIVRSILLRKFMVLAFLGYPTRMREILSNCSKKWYGSSRKTKMVNR